MHFIIADDHALVREGLAQTLQSKFPKLSITQAADGKGLLTNLESNPVTDLVLFDMFMPGTNAFETISNIVSRWPEVPLVVVSAIDNPTIIAKAIDLGASGYITKSISSDEMLRALEQVLKGGTYVQNISSPNKQSVFASQPDDYAIYTLDGLTRRQKDVAWLLAQGKGNREIAELLGVSIHTVKVHVKNIFELLGVSNRTEVLIKLKELSRVTSTPESE